MGEIMKYLLIAMLSGCMFSLGNIILKYLVSETSIYFLLINPLFIFTIVVLSGGGFILSQISMKREKASHMWLVSTAAATLIIFLTSFLIFKEEIIISEVVGIILMSVGTLLLIFKKIE